METNGKKMGNSRHSIAT